jgi:hypothetical protein
VVSQTTTSQSQTVSVPDGVELTPEYREGSVAFMSGLNDLDACSYPSGHGQGDKRTRWMSGYWGERVRQFLLRWNAKHGTGGVRCNS